MRSSRADAGVARPRRRKSQRTLEKKRGLRRGAKLEPKFAARCGMRGESGAGSSGSAEADFGCFAFGRRGDLEEFARFETQHAGEDIGWELLDFGVEIADHGVVIAARVL